MNEVKEQAAQGERHESCMDCRAVIDLQAKVNMLQKQVNGLAGAVEILDRHKVSKLSLKHFPEDAQSIIKVFNHYFKY
jgi:hypothetical protein